MKKSILITGMPGIGKSAISNELAIHGFKTFDIEGIDNLFTMIDRRTGKTFQDFDDDNLESVKQSDWICDINKLQQLLNDNSNDTVFYSGTASNLEAILPLFDKVFFLQVSWNTLRDRLTNRTSNTFGRTPEVQEWILTWMEKWQNKIIEKGVTVIDASPSLREIAEEIIDKSEVD